MNLEAIAHFKKYGYVVVEAFTPTQVVDMRTQFHQDLLKMGVDHVNLLKTGKPLPFARGKGPISQLFYSQWKLQAQLDVHAMAQTLLEATFLPGTVPGFEHPLGAATHVLPFIDRVAYRLPNQEDGLGLHMDRNPHTPYQGTYFRPIQSFIALTDHYGGASGGLQVVPHFHQDCATFFQKYVHDHPPEGGAFFRMHSKSYAAVQQRLVAVTVPAGSVVFWDNRLPHATTATLISADSREAVFFSYLPDIPLNRTYYATQIDAMKANKAPPAFGCNPLFTDPVSPDLLTHFCSL